MQLARFPFVFVLKYPLGPVLLSVPVSYMDVYKASGLSFYAVVLSEAGIWHWAQHERVVDSRGAHLRPVGGRLPAHPAPAAVTGPAEVAQRRETLPLSGPGDLLQGYMCSDPSPLWQHKHFTKQTETVQHLATICWWDTSVHLLPPRGLNGCCRMCNMIFCP